MKIRIASDLHNEMKIWNGGYENFKFPSLPDDFGMLYLILIFKLKLLNYNER